MATQQSACKWVAKIVAAADSVVRVECPKCGRRGDWNETPAQAKEHRKAQCQHCYTGYSIPPHTVGASAAPAPAVKPQTQPPAPAPETNNTSKAAPAAQDAPRIVDIPGKGKCVRFVCPHCDRGIRSPVANTGRKRSCPQCGEKVIVPAVNAPRGECVPAPAAQATPPAPKADPAPAVNPTAPAVSAPKAETRAPAVGPMTPRNIERHGVRLVWSCDCGFRMGVDVHKTYNVSGAKCRGGCGRAVVIPPVPPAPDDDAPAARTPCPSLTSTPRPADVYRVLVREDYGDGTETEEYLGTDATAARTQYEAAVDLLGATACVYLFLRPEGDRAKGRCAMKHEAKRPGPAAQNGRQVKAGNSSDTLPPAVKTAPKADSTPQTAAQTASAPDDKGSAPAPETAAQEGKTRVVAPAPVGATTPTGLDVNRARQMLLDFLRRGDSDGPVVALAVECGLDGFAADLRDIAAGIALTLRAARKGEPAPAARAKEPAPAVETAPKCAPSTIIPEPGTIRPTADSLAPATQPGPDRIGGVSLRPEDWPGLPAKSGLAKAVKEAEEAAKIVSVSSPYKASKGQLLARLEAALKAAPASEKTAPPKPTKKEVESASRVCDRAAIQGIEAPAEVQKLAAQDKRRQGKIAVPPAPAVAPNVVEKAKGPRIRYECSCGASLLAELDRAGKSLKHPTCGAVSVVPEPIYPAPAVECVEEECAEEETPPAPAVAPAALPRGKGKTEAPAVDVPAAPPARRHREMGIRALRILAALRVNKHPDAAFGLTNEAISLRSAGIGVNGPEKGVPAMDRAHLSHSMPLFAEAGLIAKGETAGKTDAHKGRAGWVITSKGLTFLASEAAVEAYLTGK